MTEGDGSVLSVLAYQVWNLATIVNRHHELTPPQSIISMFYRADRRGDPTPNDTRHAVGAATLLRQLAKVPNRAFERALGMSPAALAECAEAAIRIPADSEATAAGQPQPVFDFILGSNSRRRPS